MGAKAATVSRSQEEIEDAISQFTDADWVRLRLVANKYAVYPVEPDDLLSEGLLRAIHNRNCPTNVDVILYVAEAIRSTADSEKKLVRNRHELVPIDEEPIVQNKSSHTAVSVEENMISEQMTDSIRNEVLALFEDDEIAQLIVEGMMDEISGEELKELTGLDKTSFDSKRRLVRRRINKAYPEGWAS